ncbi:MAG: hypothetical protein IPK19_27815 [Chloroflexi bacterium]|nr:hypothetical protein [Chloroflexota bacterium]
MALVYGNDTADAFFGLLDEKLVIYVPYTHATPDLDASISAADPQLKYDAFRHRLSHTGLVTASQQAALKAVAGVTQDFKDAIDELFARGEAAVGLFFTQHPEFKLAYDVALVKPHAERHGAFVTAFRPHLASRRKRQQALQRLASAAGVDSVLCRCIVDSEGTQKALQADGRPDLSALDDALAQEVGGLEASFYFRDTPTGKLDKKVPAADTLDYAPGANPLPDPGVMSGVWRGRVEAPETGLYNIIATAGAGASVGIVLRGKALSLVQAGSTWRNKEAISLASGTLYTLEVSVAKVKDVVSIEWETPTRKREVIPAQYLYPPSTREAFSRTYVRLLKAASLTTVLHLTADEFLHFATVDEYHVDGAGWLNALPAAGSAAAATAIALLKPLEALLYLRHHQARTDGRRHLTAGRAQRSECGVDRTGRSALSPDGLEFSIGARPSRSVRNRCQPDGPS